MKNVEGLKMVMPSKEEKKKKKKVHAPANLYEAE